MSSSTPPSRSSLGWFLTGLLAAVTPFAVLVAAAATESSSQGEHITLAEWLGAMVAALLAAAAFDARRVGPAPDAGATTPASSDPPTPGH